MELHISLVGRKNLGREIYQQLRLAILDGRLRPGDRLPATRELSRRLGVSRMTVTVAYERLSAEGFTATRVGAGTFVADNVAMAGHRDEQYGTDGPLEPRPVWASISLSTAFVRPARFDFRSGLPDASLFPYQAWRRLTAGQLRPETAGAGVYGHPAGFAGLREAIAHHIGISRGAQVSADDVIVTNGTQQALDLLARVLLEPGDRVAVEDPAYKPPVMLFQSLGLEVVGVPVDADGIVVDALPARTRVVYATPAHQYPLGVSMTLPRRIALLQWAERNNAAIIEDDYDTEFRFGGKPLEPLRALDNHGRVAYVGSFSKTLLPALRIGFIVTPPSLRPALQRAKFVSDWHTPLYTQQALAAFMTEGSFVRHVRKMNREYGIRHESVATILARDFAGVLDVIPSDTGLHVCALARDRSAEDIAAVTARAFDAGVAVQGLSRLGVAGPAPPGLIIGYGAIRGSDIPDGLRRLRRCFDGGP